MKTGLMATSALAALLLAAAAPRLQQQSKLQQDLKDTAPGGNWVYNDINAGYAEANKTKKPMLVVFR